MSSSDDSSLGAELLVSILGIVVLGYVAGAYTATFRVFPYEQIFAPYLKAAADIEDSLVEQGALPYATSPWNPTGFDQFGTVTHETDATDDAGAILTSSSDETAAVLMDRDGNVRHRWKLPFREAWPDTPHIRQVAPPELIYWQHVHLLDGGDLLATYAAAGNTMPYGYGLVRLDSDSEIVWRLDARAHGDVGVDEQGHVYALTQRHRDVDADPVDGIPQIRDGRIVDNVVVEVGPDGEPRQRFSLLELLGASPAYRDAVGMYPSTVERPAEKLWDPLHPTDIDVVDAQFADHYPFAEAGQLLVTLRAIDLVILVDPDDREVDWAMRGTWWQPDDADPLPDGHLQIFDANGHGASGGASRVLETHPRTSATRWSYSGTDQAPFWSYNGGSAQKLPNDHRLITSPSSGRILEVDPDGQIVWEYRNPERRQTHDGLAIGALRDATWIPDDRLEFTTDTE